MIRDAVPADLTAVMRIARQGFHGDDRFGVVWLIKVLAQPGTRMVVEDAGVGVIRGFLLTQTYAAGTMVRLIAVDPGARNQGIAKTLLSSLPDHQCGAWIRRENEASQRTFAAAGFKVATATWSEAKKPERHTGDWVFYART